MGFIYLPYALLSGLIVFLGCRKHKKPLWWAGVALACPPASAGVLGGIYQKKRGLVISLLLVSFAAALGAEIALHLLRSRPEPVDMVPPIIKKVMELNEDIKQTTIDIYQASGKLDSVSMVQSRKTDIETSLGLIHQMRVLIEKNQQEIDALISFIDEHEAFFYRKNLDWIYAIKQFYASPSVEAHQKSRRAYFSMFETLLTYTSENFENIMEKKSAQHRGNYNAYYMRYRQAADTHNRFNRKRIAFQKQFVKEHPEVSPFLPGSHHLEPFKYWDKYSF